MPTSFKQDFFNGLIFVIVSHEELSCIPVVANTISFFTQVYATKRVSEYVDLIKDKDNGVIERGMHVIHLGW